MNINHLRKQIKNEAQSLSKMVPALSWYMFGSSLKDVTRAKDIDILIIYQQPHETVSIRKHLQELLISLPIHLTLLSEKEEFQLQFVRMQGCEKIFPL